MRRLVPCCTAKLRLRLLWADRIKACGGELRDLTHEVRKHPPRTITGVMIHVRALAGYADRERDGFTMAPSEAGLILGRGLADAVLRIGAIAA